MTERLENAQYFIGFSQELGRIICISDEEEAAKRDEMMIAELNARDNKGMVGEIMHIGPGAWCSDSAHAGELSYQGRVSFNGKTDRFDQAVGRGWTLIGLEQDPLQALSETQREQFARLEGISVSIGAPGSGSEVIDVDGVYTKWFAEIEATHVLIRPDFYVAATANSADKLQERFGKVMDLLGLIDASAIAAE
jgi:3-(3-hydroxy-phenyl)propionate hydroxylase